MTDRRLQWADKVTLERIDLMHPSVRAEVLELYLTINTRLPKGIRLRFSQTLRTFAEQDALFLKRPKVTNARGGQSIHNYGLAFDIVILYDLDGNGTFETPSWNEVKDHDRNGLADWFEVVSFFKSKGWSWGGDFKSIYDSPHFEKTFGYNSYKPLLQKWNAGDTFLNNGRKYVNL